jgi:hypothetical protein
MEKCEKHFYGTEPACAKCLLIEDSRRRSRSRMLADVWRAHELRRLSKLKPT